jgi:preprotein translocase subunit SecF
MEILRDVKVDWIGKKWIYLAISTALILAGIAGFVMRKGVPLGVDFKGGTIVYVKFNQPQTEETIRSAVQKAGLDAGVQRYGAESANEFIVAMGKTALNESAIDTSRQAIIGALDQSAMAGKYEIRNVEIVHPQVSSQLESQAKWATVYSLIGMLIYLAFRFEWVYGVAAIVAVIHDTFITVGIFALTNTEISLTVIAALLTLIGYSMNDTIVIFDRIRENLKLSRRESLEEIVNKSINETLSRTVLTSGLTFLTVAALYFFGGPVLHGFSFALVIGILIGTYSTIAVAAPVLVAYQNWRAGRGRSGVPASTDGTRKEKVRA